MSYSRKLINLRGQKFGRWTVNDDPHQRIKEETYWKCTCDCGNSRLVKANSLRSGKSVSCGCYCLEVHTTHNKSHSTEYKTWQGILGRCYNKSYTEYPLYGARGITVCDRWKDSFENFYEDMGDKPSKNHSIERIDVNGNYCPENCKWITNHEQCLNKRTKNKTGYFGVYERGLKFRAMIQYKKKSYRLGNFCNKIDAAKAYDDKCEEFYGYRPNNTEREQC